MSKGWGQQTRFLSSCVCVCFKCVGISGEIVCVAGNSQWKISLKTIDLNYSEGLFYL